MNKLIILMSVFVLIVGCGSQHSQNVKASLTPLNDKYGKPRVSPTAKKSLSGKLASNKENKVVCKRIKKTGSSIPVITCKTVAEYKSDRERSKAAARRIIEDTNRNTGRFGDN